jgi:hypothetical protein
MRNLAHFAIDPQAKSQLRYLRLAGKILFSRKMVQLGATTCNLAQQLHSVAAELRVNCAFARAAEETTGLA